MNVAVVRFCERGHALTLLPGGSRWLCGTCEQQGHGPIQRPASDRVVELVPASRCECGWQGVPLAGNRCPCCRKECP